MGTLFKIKKIASYEFSKAKQLQEDILAFEIDIFANCYTLEMSYSLAFGRVRQPVKFSYELSKNTNGNNGNC